MSLLNLADIVINGNTGTIVIPSQPMTKGGEIHAQINGQDATFQEGKAISNVDGVVTGTITPSNSTEPIYEEPVAPKKHHRFHLWHKKPVAPTAVLLIL